MRFRSRKFGGKVQPWYIFSTFLIRCETKCSDGCAAGCEFGFSGVLRGDVPIFGDVQLRPRYYGEGLDVGFGVKVLVDIVIGVDPPLLLARDPIAPPTTASMITSTTIPASSAWNRFVGSPQMRRLSSSPPLPSVLSAISSFSRAGATSSSSYVPFPYRYRFSGCSLSLAGGQAYVPWLVVSVEFGAGCLGMGYGIFVLMVPYSLCM